MRAESNAAVGRRFRTYVEPAAVVLCLGAVLWAALPVSGGEKFQITGSTNQVVLPASNDGTLLPSGSFLDRQLSPGESSQGPVVPLPGQAVLIPTPKLEELVDRKKNWMFDSPNRLDRDRALEESFGIRKYEFTGSEKKPKGAMERYFESAKDDERRRQPRDDRNPMDERDELNPGLEGRRSDRSGDEQPSGIIEALNPAQLFEWDSARPGGLPQFGRGLPGTSMFGTVIGRAPLGTAGTGDRRENTDGMGRNTPAERSWDFRRSAGGALSDPINDPIDPTRSIINPISARKPATPSAELSAKSPVSSLSPLGQTLRSGASSGFFGSTPNPAASGFNSRAPAASPASAPAQRPKPMILEIPRPMF